MFLPHCRPALYHLRDYCYPCGSKISLEMRTTKPETDIRCRLISMKQGERTQKVAKYVWASHARKERVISNVTDSRECHSGIVFTICTNQFHLPENGREGLKLVSNMALKKWNTNFCRGYSIRKIRTIFSDVPLLLEIFRWNDEKSHVSFTFQPHFPESFCKW